MSFEPKLSVVHFVIIVACHVILKSVLFRLAMCHGVGPTGAVKVTWEDSLFAIKGSAGPRRLHSLKLHSKF